MSVSNLRSWTNWTAKLEYLYIDTGTISGTATVPASLGGGTFTETAAIRDNVIRIGVNYRFSTALGRLRDIESKQPRTTKPRHINRQ